MRYEFIDAKDDATIKLFDNQLQQRAMNLPRVVALKISIIYDNMAKNAGQEIADAWMNGYVSGGCDVDLILRGVVK